MNATDGLRTLAERMDGLVLETPDMLRDAADEIDSLRELVRTLHHCAARGECDVCAMRDGRGLDEDTVCFAVHDRIRELGVDG